MDDLAKGSSLSITVRSKELKDFLPQLIKIRNDDPDNKFKTIILF